jgi:cyclopropane fatty-acyl-phospholipid synthase-like methyltransferase
MGDNLHYGYFEKGETGLKEATDVLIDNFASLARFDEETSVLDVGCGIGGPALYLHERFGCHVSGISTSSRGIEIAGKKSREKGYSEKVKFYNRDALDNGFPENSFDVVWVMESSHLMRNKERLFEENYRVLKNNGRMLLCDQMLLREFTAIDVLKYRKELAVVERSFGKAKVETIDFYKAKMGERGFKDVEAVDISEQAFPTLEKWKENILQKKDRVLEHFSEEDFNSFVLSCDILMGLFNEGIWGYGLVSGVKQV